jgi:Ribosomal_S17 N-terminal
MCCSSKKSGKGKRPGKGGNRYWKSIGLGFKTPREAIEGTIFYHYQLGTGFWNPLLVPE